MGIGGGGTGIAENRGVEVGTGFSKVSRLKWRKIYARVALKDIRCRSVIVIAATTHYQARHFPYTVSFNPH